MRSYALLRVLRVVLAMLLLAISGKSFAAPFLVCDPPANAQDSWEYRLQCREWPSGTFSTIGDTSDCRWDMDGLFNAGTDYVCIARTVDGVGNFSVPSNLLGPFACDGAGACGVSLPAPGGLKITP